MYLAKEYMDLTVRIFTQSDVWASYNPSLICTHHSPHLYSYKCDGLTGMLSFSQEGVGV